MLSVSLSLLLLGLGLQRREAPAPLLRRHGRPREAQALGNLL